MALTTKASPLALLPVPPGQTPRRWQIAALDAVRAMMARGVRRMVISAATGTGKGTLLAGIAALMAAKPGRRVLCLVHRRELIDDLAARVALVGGRVGIVRGTQNGILAPIVVASVQTLRGPRLRDLGRVDLVITDECHHATAPTYRAILDAVNARRSADGLREVVHLGFSATPFRTRAGGGTAGLGEVFDVVAYDHGIVEAIEQGDLVRPVGVRVETDVRLDGLEVRGRDYVEEDLAKIIDHDARNEAVANWYATEGGGRPFLAFAVSVAHAQRLADALAAKGARCRAVWGAMPAEERGAAIADLHAGRLDGLVSRDLLFEGFDAPRVEILLACRPTASPIIARQLVGRGLRLAPGKSSCLVVDFVGFLDVLDLEVLADLSRDAGEGAASRAGPRLRPGDLVEHRIEDLGVGQVLEVEDDLLALVAWMGAAGRRRHGVAELARCRPEAQVADLPLEVVGSRQSEVRLLPGADPAAAWGWVRLGEDGAQRWIAGWEVGDAIGAAVVAETGSGWVLWHVRGRDGEITASTAKARNEKGRMVAVYDPGLAGRIARQRAGEAWLGDRRPDLRAPWRTAPATARQLDRLRALGYRRDLSGLTGGEASSLMVAAQAWAAVQAARKENRKRHAGG